MRTLACLSLAIFLGGCGSSNQTTVDGGGRDSAVQVDGAVPDFAIVGDGSAPGACNPIDPKSDGQDCSKAACPSGTIGVSLGGGCTCLLSCTPGADTECPCDRRCITLTAGDMGVVGGACLVGNGAGERCGADASNMPFGHGLCAQNLTCAGDASGKAYCLWNCGAQADCPVQTSCFQITNQQQMVVGMACTYNAGASGVASGSACTPAGQACITDNLCDTTCKPQCDGPGATCASGTCTALTDAAKGQKLIGYVCK
ncbi:MAG: hypothetical protein ACHQ17_02790 [Polyangia bacterium]